MFKSGSENLINWGSNQKTIIIPCPVCNSFKNYELLFQKNSYNIVKCNICEFSFINPQPDPSLIFDFYNCSSDEWNSTESELPVSKFFIKKVFKLQVRGNWLDIGCSEGHLLSEAKKIGYTVQGIELNSNAIRKGLMKYGVNILNIDFLTYRPDYLFEIISMFRLFEHLHDPNNYLNKIWNILIDQGLLIISVPNYLFGIKLYRLSKIFRWIKKIESTVNVFSPPGHLLHFTPKTIEQILNKNKFVVVKKGNTPPTYEKSSTIRNFLKFVAFEFTEAIYYLTFKRLILNYNFWIIAKKQG